MGAVMKCSCTQGNFPSALCPMHGALCNNSNVDWTWDPAGGPLYNPIIC